MKSDTAGESPGYALRVLRKMLYDDNPRWYYRRAASSPGSLFSGERWTTDRGLAMRYRHKATAEADGVEYGRGDPYVVEPC